MKPRPGETTPEQRPFVCVKLTQLPMLSTIQIWVVPEPFVDRDVDTLKSSPLSIWVRQLEAYSFETSISTGTSVNAGSPRYLARSAKPAFSAWESTCMYSELLCAIEARSYPSRIFNTSIRVLPPEGGGVSDMEYNLDVPLNVS